MPVSDAGEIRLEGNDGLFSQPIKVGLERSLQTETSKHLGTRKAIRKQGSSRTHIAGHIRKRWTPRSEREVGDPQEPWQHAHPEGIVAPA